VRLENLMLETAMDDEYYRRSVKAHHAGGYQLCAEALDPKAAEGHYPSTWVCSHGVGEFHATFEDAIDCPQYWELLGQIT
jgi:hypothetical protein